MFRIYKMDEGEMCDSLKRIQINFTLLQITQKPFCCCCCFHIPIWHPLLPVSRSEPHGMYQGGYAWEKKKGQPNDKTFTITVSALNMNFGRIFLRQRNFPQIHGSRLCIHLHTILSSFRSSFRWCLRYVLVHIYLLK